MGPYKASAQRDLFATTQTAARLPPEVTQRLLPLLEVLLAEVMTADTPAREGRDEQDHP